MKSNIKALIGSSNSVYSLPSIHARLNNKRREINSSNIEIADIILSDPGLTMVVLKIVNSAVYGFSHTISTVSQAVTILGRIELSVLLFSTGIINVFNKLPISNALMTSHWRHSLMCGLIAKRLAMECGLASESSTLFVAGLLHDMGKPIIWQHFPDQSKLLYVEADSNNINEREYSLFGYDHAEVGYELMKLWGLPEILLVSTLKHHNPELALLYPQACQLIYLANRLAHQDAGNLDDLFQELASVLNHLQLPEAILENSLDEAENQLLQMAEYFGVRL